MRQAKREGEEDGVCNGACLPPRSLERSINFVIQLDLAIIRPCFYADVSPSLPCLATALIPLNHSRHHNPGIASPFFHNHRSRTQASQCGNPHKPCRLSISRKSCPAPPPQALFLRPALASSTRAGGGHEDADNATILRMSKRWRRGCIWLWR